MIKQLINTPIVWPNVAAIAKWSGVGLLIGILSLYYIRVFSGPAQVAFANAPYTVIPVLLLTYTVTHLTNRKQKTSKYHELIDTIHMNLYVSFAYFIFQLIVFICTKSLDYNKENDHQLKYYVYLGCLIGIVVFIAIIFFIQMYLH